jgi:hypothetical protein
MFWLARRSVDFKLMSASETSKHLRNLPGFSLVDVVFLAMLVDVINWLGVMAGLTVINVFGHDLILPYKNVKTVLKFPGPLWSKLIF